MIETIQKNDNIFTSSVINGAINAQNQEVTAVIFHCIRSGYESRYETWLKKISMVAGYFPGHSGVTILRPNSDSPSEYTIFLRFDSYKNLYQWLVSPLIKEWLYLAKALIETSEDVQILNGLKALVSSPEKQELTTWLTDTSG